MGFLPAWSAARDGKRTTIGFVPSHDNKTANNSNHNTSL